MESYKVHKALTDKQIVDPVTQHDVFNYIRGFYNILYTIGYLYIDYDIDIYLKARNVVFPV